jgi:hypothetical protein
MSNQENRIRKMAARSGYRVTKSRRQESGDNFGEYMLANEHNHIVLGEKFDASLEDIEAYLRDKA